MNKLWKVNIEKNNAETMACIAWSNDMFLDDLMNLYDVTIDMDSIEMFNDKHKSLEEEWNKLNGNIV